MIKSEREEDVKKYTEEFGQALRLAILHFELSTGVKIERIELKENPILKCRDLKLCINVKIFQKNDLWTYKLRVDN